MVSRFTRYFQETLLEVLEKRGIKERFHLWSGRLEKPLFGRMIFPDLYFHVPGKERKKFSVFIELEMGGGDPVWNVEKYEEFVIGRWVSPILMFHIFSPFHWDESLKTPTGKLKKSYFPRIRRGGRTKIDWNRAWDRIKKCPPSERGDLFCVWAKEKAISKGRELSDHDFHYIPIEMEIDYDEFFHLFHYKRLPSRVKHPRGRVRREIQRLANEIIREIGSFQRKIKPAW